jgi:hypothetical protein
MNHRTHRQSRDLPPVRTTIIPPVRTPSPNPTYAAPDPAAYRWLLRWLFSNDTTPPRLDYEDRRAA